MCNNLKLVLMRNKFPAYISEKPLKHYYAFTNAGVPAIWTPWSKSASGYGLPRSKSASGYGLPRSKSADLDPPPTKLKENIILTSVLVKMDNTLCSSAY